jgi:hypothetical protein
MTVKFVAVDVGVLWRVKQTTLILTLNLFNEIIVARNCYARGAQYR